MSDNSGYSAAALAEELKQDVEEDLRESVAHWWTPYIEDRGTLSLLNQLARSFDPAEHDELEKVEDSELFRDIFLNETGRTVQKAIQEQNLSAQSAVAGLNGSENDVSGTRRLLDVSEKLVDTEAYIGYIYGDMGSGKTDFALLLAELWERQTGGAVGTNITTLEQADVEIETFGALEDWLAGSGEKLFVFDEASSHASGYAGDAGSVTSKFRGLLREFRKRNANLLIVGHTGKDVHPDIRRLATDCIHKQGKKQAVFYESVEEGDGEGEKFDIEGIPATEWSFDTNEITTWSWSSEATLDEDRTEDHDGRDDRDEQDDSGGGNGPTLTEDERERIRWLYQEQDASQSDLAEKYEVSQATISRVIQG